MARARSGGLGTSDAYRLVMAPNRKLSWACLLVTIVATFVAESSARAADPARDWQGAWVVRDASYPGSVQAWHVRGDVARVYDARRNATETESFSIVAPCRVARVRVLPNRTTITDYDTFVFARDGLHLAMAPANGGFLRGGVATACVGRDLIVFDTRTKICRSRPMLAPGPMSLAQYECVMVRAPGGPYLSIRALSGGDTVRLGVYGNALLSNALLAHVAEPAPSFDAAIRRAAMIQGNLGAR
jgi:hypothetical protein